MKSELETQKFNRSVNVSVLNSPLKVAGSIFIGLAALTAAWGFLAPIPVKVNGLGVLTPVDGLFTYEAPSVGNVLLLFVFDKKDSEIKYSVPNWSSRAYKFSHRGINATYHDSVKLTEDILAYMNEVVTTRMSMNHFESDFHDSGKYIVKMNEGDAIAIIDQPASRKALSNNLQILKRSITNYQNLVTLNKNSLSLSRKVEKAKTKLLAPLNNLVEEGFASQVEFNTALADATNTRIAVSDYSTKLQNAQLEIEKNKKNLLDELSTYIEKSVVFAYDESYVQAFVTSQWAFVQPGAELVTVSWSVVSDPSVIPVFVDQKVATEVEVGQDVILTPLGFSSAEIGGIMGKIQTVESIPYTTATLARRLNSQGLAALVSPRGSVYQVNVKLQKEDMKILQKEASKSSISFSRIIQNSNRRDNRGGYLWNNRSNPPVEPREGFLLTTQITTRVNTPIQMLIPVLKEFTGFAPPDKLIRHQLNQP